MPGKTPHSNGNEPVENGIRSNQDVDMKDDIKGKGKKAAKDGDEEMTVVVPKTRPVKSSTPPDKDGDVAMGDEAEKDAENEIKVDPVVQTSTGEFLFPSILVQMSMFHMNASATSRFADVLSPSSRL